MANYNISPDFLKDILQELQYNPYNKDLFIGITKNTKATLTRLYNQTHKTSIKKCKNKRRDSFDDEEEEEEDEDNNV